MLRRRVDPESCLGPHVVDLPDEELTDFLLPGGHSSCAGWAHIMDEVAFRLPSGCHVEPSENNAAVVMLCAPSGCVGWSSDAVAVGESLRVAVNVVLTDDPVSLWQDELLPTTRRYLAGMSVTPPAINEVVTPWGPGLDGEVTMIDRTVGFYMLGACGPGWLVRMTAFCSDMDESAKYLVQELMASTVIRGQILDRTTTGAVVLHPATGTSVG